MTTWQKLGFLAVGAVLVMSQAEAQVPLQVKVDLNGEWQQESRVVLGKTMDDPPRSSPTCG